MNALQKGRYIGKTKVCGGEELVSIGYERVLFRCFTIHTVSTGFSFSLVLSQTDKLSKATFSLAGCGGVTRVVSTGDSRQFVLSLSLAGSQPLLLADGAMRGCPPGETIFTTVQQKRHSYTYICVCMIIYPVTEK